MIDKENNFVSVVVYLNDSEHNIENFLNMVYPTIDSNFKKYELIFVSNYQNEIVKEKIKEFKKKYEKISVSFITLDNKSGLEECMNAGIDMSIGDFVFEFDSCYVDYSPSVIMDVYRKALEGNDIVAAIPPAKTMRTSSKVFYAVYNHFSDMKNLTTERFRVISRRAINRVAGYNKIVPYRKAVYASVGLCTSQVMYQLCDGATGELPIDFQRKNIAIDALILFTDIAYKLSLAFSILMAVFMLGTGIYTITQYARGGVVEGWAPLMGVISAGFLALFIIVTVLIKYLDLLLKLAFKKQKYMVVGIDKL